MQINIATPGVTISEGLLHLIRSRFSRLERMFVGITSCEITLSTINDSDHRNYAMEANLVAPKEAFYDRERANCFEVALAQLIDNLSIQLKQHKLQGDQSP